LIDIIDIMVVESSYNKKPFFFALGKSNKNETGISSAEIGKDNLESRTDLEWEIFYDSTILPRSIPSDKAKDLMANLVSATTGNASVYKTGTVYIPSSGRPAKGNAPVLRDFQIARKLEEAKRRNILHSAAPRLRNSRHNTFC
jgi:hypothetical protein